MSDTQEQYTNDAANVLEFDSVKNFHGMIKLLKPQLTRYTLRCCGVSAQ